jgi:hypothetical protein
MLPPDHATSNCCLALLVKLPIGNGAEIHWECKECKGLWVWNGHEFIPCQLPDVHRELATGERR